MTLNYKECRLSLHFDSMLPLLIMLVEVLLVCMQLMSSILDILESSVERSHG